MHHVSLAFDLGASSGRASVGVFDGETIRIEEVHRFDTPLVEHAGRLRWDLDALWAEIRRGFEAAARLRDDIHTLSVDSWAVDFVRLDAAGRPVAAPFAYRDPRVRGVMDVVFRRMSRDRLFAVTGIQFMEINTIYQLYADARNEPELAERTALCLPIADYFNYRFGGRAIVERSMASTTQLMDVRTGDWSGEIMASLNLDAGVWPPIVESATVIGRHERVDVVAGCSHDTACAVAAVPAAAERSAAEDGAGPGFVRAGGSAPDQSGTRESVAGSAHADGSAPAQWAFLSCGTWSLLGVERTEPLLTQAALDAAFTNEAGFGGTIRFLKNITGLWILQECEREWHEAGVEYTYEGLFRDAGRTSFADGVIDVDDPRFAERGNMVAKVRELCAERGLSAPKNPGEITRRILDGIAHRHRAVLREAEALTGIPIGTLHMVGGGSRIDLLCRLTADACGCTVVAGPAEATTAGNHLIQAHAAGKVDHLTDIRSIVRRSFETRRFSPSISAAL